MDVRERMRKKNERRLMHTHHSNADKQSQILHLKSIRVETTKDKSLKNQETGISSNPANLMNNRTMDPIVDLIHLSEADKRRTDDVGRIVVLLQAIDAGRRGRVEDLVLDGLLWRLAQDDEAKVL